MYGGGFATVPAYLADIFGSQMVGAIHGRLLTAWATAGILGPVVVNYMRDYQIGLGIPREQVYNQTMYILVGMLVVGLICNLLIKPLDEKWFMTDAELAEEKRLAHEKIQSDPELHSSTSSVTPLWIVLGAWTVVGLPMAWGAYRALQSVAKFIH
jgi:MFS family permease